jgi:hypothetical protein
MSFIVFAMACGGENKLNTIEGGNGGNGGVIEVTPLSLNFGEVSSSDSEGTVESFLIRSIGSNDITVSGVDIMGEDGTSFTILTVVEDLVLSPEEEQQVDILFEPMGANQQLAQAVVHSDDESEPHIPVNLVGIGIISELEITPDPLNFGSTYVGCEKGNTVTLTNVGNESLDVTDIEYIDNGFAVVGTPNMPFTLAPGESETVEVGFTPAVDYEVEGSFLVTSTEPMGVRTVMHLGTGLVSARYEQIWENPIDPPSDILFSVDLSCSMGDDAATLANEFSTFINELSNYSNDWQIMVANDDDGCNRGQILRPTTSNYQALFSDYAQGFNGGGGFFGSLEPMYTESLLTIASLAVENTDQAECNTGFLREHALLHIIMVSDEPEQSQGNWSDYVNQIVAKKGNAANVRFSAIAGDVPSGCTTGTNSADAGTGYWDAVNATGGVFMSLCSNWTSPQNLQVLAEASVILDSYPLDNPAVEGSIEVYINGNAVTSGWHYDSTLNSVVFDSTPPEEGDHVRIVYSAMSQCD